MESEPLQIPGRFTSLREQLSTANVVIVSAGFNDQAPWPDDRPCQNDGGATFETKIAAILQYSDSCIEDTIASYQPAYESVFGEISALVPEPRVLIALDVYNVVPGNPRLEAITSKDDLRSLTMVTTRILNQWNQMLCQTAAAHEFTCVDTHGAFNGADRTTPPDALLESDYNHPSQSGNDLITDLLKHIDASQLESS